MKDKEIDLLGTKYSINYVDKIDSDDKDDDKFFFGICDSIRRKIKIATKDTDGNKFEDRDISITFFHELFHAILNEGCYDDISDNEPLVEWVAKCLAHLKEKGYI